MTDEAQDPNLTKEGRPRRRRGRPELPPSPRGVLLAEFIHDKAREAGEAPTRYMLFRGIPSTTIGKWRGGVEPELATMIRVAEAMRLPLLDLLVAGQFIDEGDVRARAAEKAITFDDLVELLGEGFHTALRKAADSREALIAWRAINVMPGDEWSAILDFVADPIAKEVGIRR